ncbi:endonuclease domain-containing protein [Mycolicibacterium llatzerense]|uniref:endonuclease domain-containing protein n=1 Tax=Mycolicibacterium llatzerense TaxID=280871 RepID=UPI001F1B0F79|nr:endonuclease domain-containing protein [Mycolicibacterium llatzerense]
MGEPFIGSEALSAGRLTRHQLRTNFVAVHKDVYVPRGTRPTAIMRAKAVWLRSKRRGVLAGFSAAALHGARFIGPEVPAYICDRYCRSERGVVLWRDIPPDDEVCCIGEMRLTTPVRTAVDLARRLPEDAAVAAIDALARAARLTVADIETAAERQCGQRGIRQARKTIALVDPKAESPRETALRLLIIRAGLPKPESQYPIYNEYGALIGVVDFAWPELKIAIEYEGVHHTDPDAVRRDIARIECMVEVGWLVIRVTARDPAGVVLHRLINGRASRGAVDDIAWRFPRDEAERLWPTEMRAS